MIRRINIYIYSIHIIYIHIVLTYKNVLIARTLSINSAERTHRQEQEYHRQEHWNSRCSNAIAFTSSASTPQGIRPHIAEEKRRTVTYVFLFLAPGELGSNKMRRNSIWAQKAGSVLSAQKSVSGWPNGLRGT